ncbi:MAG: ribulose-phosphate 3-epimerase [Candidatus Peregrinibacteria bacterium]|nr:ribulose-phosphate 3-epimerase [Candidatus Peregrinibacteria bacterium]
MANRILITPSILAADLGHLQEEIDSVADHADWIQIDVMDGHFVPNLSFGAPVIKCLKTKLPIDVHLMVTNPADRIDEFLAAGAKHITFHAEAVEDTKSRKALLEAIRKGGATAGIALNPETPVNVIDDVVADVDLVLIMSVHPGFSGQKFLPDVLEKVRALRSQFPKLMIQMDGGIDATTAKQCRDAGANNLVAGNAIFSSADRAAAISSLRGS